MSHPTCLAKDGSPLTYNTAIVLCLTLVIAFVDWWAVNSPTRRPIELIAKPLTLIMLIVVALALQPFDASVRMWFVVALLFSLLGDIFLMLEERYFVFGLAAFLLGHLAYIAGFWMSGRVDVGGLLIGVLVVVLSSWFVGRRIIEAVMRAEPALVAPVLGYMAVISLMVASAFGSLSLWAIGGSMLFYASDSLIAWNRFIEHQPWGRLGIITTYHLGQIGLVLSLV